MKIEALDPVIHAPKRLAVMAILANSSSVDFAFLRDQLGITDSDLSKQMSALADAGYVKVDKIGRGRGGNTWYQITKAGEAAFAQHVEALSAIVASSIPQVSDQS